MNHVTGDPVPDPSPPTRTSGTPRWVKILLALVVVLVLALVISKLVGMEHGPGMHGGPSSPSTHTGPPAGGHVPPVQHAP